MNKGLLSALIIIGVLILLAGSFYGGMVFGEQRAQADLPEAFRERMAQFGQGEPAAPGAVEGQLGQGGFGRLGGQGGGLFGQIEEINGDTIVVTGFDGQQTVVQITDTTLIEKYASVTASELAPGEQVTVSGSENEDGSITARSVQVAPAGRFAPGAGQGGRGSQ
ncbi:MAG TPA: DUF5666 domain-containing protein [Anaerolineae bacterium]|nr:DUF5666 domain-containing protein [Anaerolineae bacterium]